MATSGIATASANCTVTQQWARRIGPLGQVSVQVTYNGVDITVNTNGDMTDVDLFSLTSAWSPASISGWQPIKVQAVAGSGATIFGAVLKSSGQVTLLSGIPGLKLKAGDGLAFYDTVALDS